MTFPGSSSCCMLIFILIYKNASFVKKKLSHEMLHFPAKVSAMVMVNTILLKYSYKVTPNKIQKLTLKLDAFSCVQKYHFRSGLNAMQNVWWTFQVLYFLLSFPECFLFCVPLKHTYRTASTFVWNGPPILEVSQLIFLQTNFIHIG